MVEESQHYWNYYDGDEKINSGKIIENFLDAGYFGQFNIDRLDFNLTVYEELYNIATDKSETEIRKICEQVMFKGSTADKKLRCYQLRKKAGLCWAKFFQKMLTYIILTD